MAKQLFACLLLVLAFCVARTLQQNVTCTPTGSDICRCTGDGITLDISNYLTYPVKDIPDKKNASKYSYTFAPCDGTPATECGGKEGDANVKICQVYVQDSNRFTVIATDVDRTWVIVNRSAESLMFVVLFTKGEGGRSAAVIFQHDNSAPAITNGLEDESTNTYFFTVTGSNVKAVGGGGSKKGGGAAAGVVGLVLISLFIVGVATYFIVGALVNYYHRGARGAEVIPNYAFWKDLPFLIKDGFLFIISPCYKKGEEKGYQSL